MGGSSATLVHLGIAGMRLPFSASHDCQATRSFSPGTCSILGVFLHSASSALLQARQQTSFHSFCPEPLKAASTQIIGCNGQEHISGQVREQFRVAALIHRDQFLACRCQV